MLREIMRVDGCSYVEAYAVRAKMNLHLEGRHFSPQIALPGDHRRRLGPRRRFDTVRRVPEGPGHLVRDEHVGVDLPPAEED